MKRLLPVLFFLLLLAGGSASAQLRAADIGLTFPQFALLFHPAPAGTDATLPLLEGAMNKGKERFGIMLRNAPAGSAVVEILDSTGSLLKGITVTVTLSSPGATLSMDTIRRYYTISQSGGSGFSSTLRLHYEDAEISAPNAESTLKLWRRSGTSPDVWTRQGATSASTVDNWVESSGVTAFGAWSLSSKTLPKIVLALVQDLAAPAPGDEVRYTISYLNSGDAPATSTIVSAAAPVRTSYVGGTVRINGVTRTDAADADEVTVAGSSITVNLSTVTASASGTISYSVRIN
jgi:uncharacterized repeat protein (TIGR01451 family)